LTRFRGHLLKGEYDDGHGSRHGGRDSYDASVVKVTRTNSWDQLLWAQYWSEVFRLYNKYDRKYCTVRRTITNPKTRQVVVTCDAQEGLSVVIRKGLIDYDPFALSPSPSGP
jgi:hypothetical protein